MVTVDFTVKVEVIVTGPLVIVYETVLVAVTVFGGSMTPAVTVRVVVMVVGGCILVTVAGSMTSVIAWATSRVVLIVEVAVLDTILVVSEGK